MRERSESIIRNIDWFTVGIYLVLMALGWLTTYSAVYKAGESDIFDLSRQESKQLMFDGISILLAGSILIIDASFFTATAFFFYGGMLFLNLLVLVLGTSVKGSHSWFRFGGFGLQPAELMKFATGLALAKYLSDLNKPDLKKIFLTTMSFILIPMVIIAVLQNETGCALVFLSLIIVLFREGVFPVWLLVFGIVSIASAILGLKYPAMFWAFVIFMLVMAGLVFFFARKKTIRLILVLIAGVIFFSCILHFTPIALEKISPHQQFRIKIWLNLPVTEKVEKKYGYNTNQSMNAIGSGGMLGKGFLEGTVTKNKFVPEHETDFIFCTMGEEGGFVGTSFVVMLYLILIVRIIFMAERQRSDFSRIYGYAVASIFFSHLVVNIGMTIGLLLVIGIPLPFFSYGGSSLIGFTLL
ncbi:MAG: rod shape-determining protein RodA, partial [Bacteroidia bacterium]